MNSISQFSMVDVGTTMRWGPQIQRAHARWDSKEMVCTMDEGWGVVVAGGGEGGWLGVGKEESKGCTGEPLAPP